MMMVFSLRQIEDSLRDTVGGKAVALASIARAGFAVPRAICIGAPVYDHFVEATGLRARIVMEYDRKPYDQMRWEEIWDTALRIQSLFINAKWPADIVAMLRKRIGSEFAGVPVVVRSSAIGEDSAKASFAGLHESFVNVRGATSILEHIKLVWASLWSDRAMLYRTEVGLDVNTSRMAVIVQELVEGQKSGVIFGVSPTDEATAVIEAVHGLNQGLVDGTIQPDRWMIARATGTVTSHIPASREKMVARKPMGVAVVPLSRPKRSQAPLRESEVYQIFHAEKALEKRFGAPQDVEWTYRGAQLHILQSRPITTASHLSQQDLRPWYVSLHRSLETLKELRRSIENEYVPQMIRQAEQLAGLDMTTLTDKDLAREIHVRQRVLRYWHQIYWDQFIPFAHGIRLFGQIYNRVLKPKDPHEFLRLLPSEPLKSVERNHRLIQAAREVGRRRVSHMRKEADSSTLSVLLQTAPADRQEAFLRELAGVEETGVDSNRMKTGASAKRFLKAFPARERTHAAEILELARASYKLRDDDNIYLGRIEAELLRALEETRNRSSKAAKLEIKAENAELFARALVVRSFRLPRSRHAVRDRPGPAIRARQLIGQPAGHGVVVGRARVVLRAEDLLDFKRGEVLVCDAVDPNMTFVVPLAAGIVERRGGMLIHGAIIAREYGLPCVTGVPNVCKALKTGDSVTVDGYLGIVTIGSSQANPLGPTTTGPRPHRVSRPPSGPEVRAIAGEKISSAVDEL
jgi:pyruvate,water dikinase